MRSNPLRGIKIRFLTLYLGVLYDTVRSCREFAAQQSGILLRHKFTVEQQGKLSSVTVRCISAITPVAIYNYIYHLIMSYHNMISTAIFGGPSVYCSIILTFIILFLYSYFRDYADVMKLFPNLMLTGTSSVMTCRINFECIVGCPKAFVSILLESRCSWNCNSKIYFVENIFTQFPGMKRYFRECF